jgi:hypothetical protein
MHIQDSGGHWHRLLSFKGQDNDDCTLVIIAERGPAVANILQRNLELVDDRGEFW